MLFRSNSMFQPVLRVFAPLSFLPWTHNSQEKPLVSRKDLLAENITVRYFDSLAKNLWVDFRVHNLLTAYYPNNFHQSLLTALSSKILPFTFYPIKLEYGLYKVSCDQHKGTM